MDLVFKTKKPESEGVFSFTFTPPWAAKWQGGQSIRLEIPGIYGPEERRFTIASSPHERDIMITTRLSGSTFKQALSVLAPGAHIKGYDIRGNFVWQEETSPKVFVASGVGITSFRAILAERISLGLPIPVALVYASREDPQIFGEEIASWVRQRPEFSFIACPRQRLTAELLATRIKDIATKTIYLSGPSAMVNDLSATMVQGFGVPSEALVKDWFTGRLDWEG